MVAVTEQQPVVTVTMSPDGDEERRRERERQALIEQIEARNREVEAERIRLRRVLEESERDRLEFEAARDHTGETDRHYAMLFRSQSSPDLREVVETGEGSRTRSQVKGKGTARRGPEQEVSVVITKTIPASQRGVGGPGGGRNGDGDGGDKGKKPAKTGHYAEVGKAKRLRRGIVEETEAELTEQGPSEIQQLVQQAEEPATQLPAVAATTATTATTTTSAFALETTTGAEQVAEAQQVHLPALSLSPGSHERESTVGQPGTPALEVETSPVPMETSPGPSAYSPTEGETTTTSQEGTPVKIVGPKKRPKLRLRFQWDDKGRQEGKTWAELGLDVDEDDKEYVQASAAESPGDRKANAERLATLMLQAQKWAENLYRERMVEEAEGGSDRTADELEQARRQELMCRALTMKFAKLKREREQRKAAVKSRQEAAMGEGGPSEEKVKERTKKYREEEDKAIKRYETLQQWSGLKPARGTRYELREGTPPPVKRTRRKPVEEEEEEEVQMTSEGEGEEESPEEMEAEEAARTRSRRKGKMPIRVSASPPPCDHEGDKWDDDDGDGDVSPGSDGADIWQMGVWGDQM